MCHERRCIMLTVAQQVSPAGQYGTLLAESQKSCARRKTILTQQSHNFTLNYDIKYRLGRCTEEDE
jgi:hypothetical protein